MSDFNTDDVNDLILKDIAIEELMQRINELEAENKRLAAENGSYEKREHAYIAQIEAQENNDE